VQSSGPVLFAALALLLAVAAAVVYFAGNEAVALVLFAASLASGAVGRARSR
jgi:hypothetical protein